MFVSLSVNMLFKGQKLLSCGICKIINMYFKITNQNAAIMACVNDRKRGNRDICASMPSDPNKPVELSLLRQRLAVTFVELSFMSESISFTCSSFILLHLVGIKFSVKSSMLLVKNMLQSLQFWALLLWAIMLVGSSITSRDVW